MIILENIGKKYTIRHENEHQYTTLREEVVSVARNILSSQKRISKKEEFWALNNININVDPGEKIGIIGRNGAGKSTLLKLISRITEPTNGKIKIKGRVASLLEVGTGFHPELTGRENIFLNGVILGMSRVEIRKKFDEIVAFADFEKFLDTPVKRYSSGMQVRLAFSVAAHLDSEILIVDEVLAVGDTLFQKKCIDKMLEVTKEGRTILFVSHNLSSIKTLCDRGILLERGQIISDGAVQEVIEEYTSGVKIIEKEVDLSSIERKVYQNDIIFERIIFNNMPINFGEPIRFKIKLKTLKDKMPAIPLLIGIAINDVNNNSIIHCSNRFLGEELVHDSDSNEYYFEINNILRPARYQMTLFLRTGDDQIQDWLTDSVRIIIEGDNPYSFPDTSLIQGSILPKYSIKKLNGSDGL